tara:strand:- start:1 stop:612 length:612 start_codon:yes stop_codon:yes gene_type:complete
MCFPNSWYSYDVTINVINQLNDKFLNQFKSDGPDFFSQWRGKISDVRKIKKVLNNLILTAIKETKIPVMRINGVFNNYLETQLAYFIFESLLKNTLNNENDINNLPLLEVPINSIFYKIPPTDKEIITNFINKFRQLKEKQIDFTMDLNAFDKTLLNIKLDMEIENAINKIDFALLVNKIYTDYTQKNNVNIQHLENEIKSNL